MLPWGNVTIKTIQLFWIWKIFRQKQNQVHFEYCHWGWPYCDCCSVAPPPPSLQVHSLLTASTAWSHTSRYIRSVDGKECVNVETHPVTTLAHLKVCLFIICLPLPPCNACGLKILNGSVSVPYLQDLFWEVRNFKNVICYTLPFSSLGWRKTKSIK